MAVSMADSPAVLRFTAGLAGDIYEQSLEGIRSVLLMVGERHWLAWMEEDLRLYRDEGSTEHHRGAYGGMGSFNDLVLSAPGGENQSSAVWLDAALDQLRHLARSSAQAAGSEPDGFLQVGSGSGTGRLLDIRWDHCRSCGNDFINSWDREVAAANAWSTAEVPLLVGSRRGAQVANAAVGGLASDGRQRYVDHVERKVDDLHLRRHELGRRWEAACPSCGERSWLSSSAACF
jgi:hypothetical protein